MAGNIYNIEKLNSNQIDNLDRNKTVFIIAVSPLEQHGPHLPVGLDVFNAKLFAENAAKVIVEHHPEYDAALFPLIPLGTQVFKHTGSFYVKPSTLYDIVYNTGKGIALYGFKHILVFSAHGTPKQIVTIESACGRVSKKYGVNMLGMTGAIAAKFLSGEMFTEIGKVLGRSFTDDEKHLLKYDYHAGWWETAMMLKFYPELVDANYKTLKPYLKDLVKKKVLTPDEKFRGYLGAPAKADIAFADASMKVFTDIAVKLISRLLNGEDITKDVTSPYYKWPMFHPFFKRNLVLGIVAVVFVVFMIAIWLNL